MVKAPFWITDLRRGKDLEVATPLSREVEDLLLDSVNNTSAKDPERRRIECREHDDDPRLAEFRDSRGRVPDVWMYPQKWPDHWRLCHYEFTRKPGIKLGDHIVETAAHRALKDGLQSALEDGQGCQTVSQEHSLGGRIVDVWAVGHDGRSYAFEADHTTRGYRAAQRKDDTDRTLGVQATIFCADKPSPGYADRVAHTEIADLPFRNGRPDPRRWPIARGPRRVEFHRCRPGSVFTRGCPELRGRRRAATRYCGQEHPFFVNWADGGSLLTVADLGERLPAGDLVVVRPKLQRIEATLVEAGAGRAVEDYLRSREPVPPPILDQRATRHLRQITADELRERIPIQRRDLREECEGCGERTGLADGLCMRCRDTQAEARTWLAGFPRDEPPAEDPDEADPSSCPTCGGLSTDPHERRHWLCPEPGSDDALAMRPGVMRAVWWLRCGVCSALVHGPGASDQPCPCGRWHARGDLIGLVTAPGSRQVWACRTCLLASANVPAPRGATSSSTTARSS